MNARFWVPIFLLVFLSFGIGRSVAQDDDGSEPVPDHIPACAVSIPKLNGIVTKISRVTSDSEVAANLIVNNQPVDPLTAAQVALGSNLVMGEGSQSVKIIIVDFFDGVTNPLNYQAGSTPDMGNWIDGSQVPHGVAVYQYTQELVNALNNSQIHLGFVDISGIPQGDIAEIRRSIDNRIANAELGPNARFVINMSFALVPCEIDGLAFEAYMDGVAVGDLQGLEAPLHSSLLVDGDPILDAIQDCDTTYPTEYVAGAGNAGLGFAFVPAAWDGVIGVGAAQAWQWRGWSSDPAYQATAVYSNYGIGVDEFELGGWIGGVVNDLNFMPLAIQGTSLAAPLHTVRLAARMSQGEVIGQRCSLLRIAQSYNRDDDPDFNIVDEEDSVFIIYDEAQWSPDYFEDQVVAFNEVFPGTVVQVTSENVAYANIASGTFIDSSALDRDSLIIATSTNIACEVISLLGQPDPSFLRVQTMDETIEADNC